MIKWLDKGRRFPNKTDDQKIRRHLTECKQSSLALLIHNLQNGQEKMDRST